MTATEGLLSEGTTFEVTAENAGEIYVAINPVEATLSYSIGGVQYKEVNLTFAAKYIYNLGYLVAPYKWGFYGAHQGWDVENPDKMFKVAENVYAAKNVTLASNGFKFINIESIQYVEPNNPVYDLYLKPNSNWKSSNARFAAYFFGNGEKWVSMTKVDNDTWGVNKPTDKNYPNVIFCRMNPSAAANNWDNRWNQTGDIVISTTFNGKNCISINAGQWNCGSNFTTSTITVDNTPYWEYTDFGAWKDSANGYFNYSTDMDAGAWYEVADNNLGGQSFNIGVTDFTKTYDIYIKESVQTWGSLLNYTIVEHGTEVAFE